MHSLLGDLLLSSTEFHFHYRIACYSSLLVYSSYKLTLKVIISNFFLNSKWLKIQGLKIIDLINLLPIFDIKMTKTYNKNGTLFIDWRTKSFGFNELHSVVIWIRRFDHWIEWLKLNWQLLITWRRQNSITQFCILNILMRLMFHLSSVNKQLGYHILTNGRLDECIAAYNNNHNKTEPEQKRKRTHTQASECGRRQIIASKRKSTL